MEHASLKYSKETFAEMYEALRVQHDAMDILFTMLIVRDQTFLPSQSGEPWEALLQGNAALDKAEGKR